MRALADERKYAKIVGAVNLSRLEDLKSTLRDADGEIAEARRALKAIKEKPQDCQGEALGQLVACDGSYLLRADETPAPGEACQNPDIQTILRLMSN